MLPRNYYNSNAKYYLAQSSARNPEEEFCVLAELEGVEIGYETGPVLDQPAHGYLRSNIDFKMPIFMVQRTDPGRFARVQSIDLSKVDISREMAWIEGYAAEVKKKPFEIKNVYFNDPVTVVLWTDGTKTIVRAQNNEPYDPEKGLAMAFAKKALGNKGSYYDEFKKRLPERKEEKVPRGASGCALHDCRACKYYDEPLDGPHCMPCEIRGYMVYTNWTDPEPKCECEGCKHLGNMDICPRCNAYQGLYNQLKCSDTEPSTEASGRNCDTCAYAEEPADNEHCKTCPWSSTQD